MTFNLTVSAAAANLSMRRACKLAAVSGKERVAFWVAFLVAVACPPLAAVD
jgi:hypothetical protein